MEKTQYCLCCRFQTALYNLFTHNPTLGDDLIHIVRKQFSDSCVTLKPLNPPLYPYPCLEVDFGIHTVIQVTAMQTRTVGSVLLQLQTLGYANHNNNITTDQRSSKKTNSGKVNMFSSS